MNKKTIITVALIVILLFFASIFISYKLTSGDSKKEEKVDNSTEISQEVNNETIDNNETENKKDLEYKEINKNSKIAQELYEFVPKSYQTYKNKMTEDYMIYEAITRLSKDENIETVAIGEFYGYRYTDVDNMVKEIYGPEVNAVKKDQYVSPIEYIEASDAYCLYPYGFDSTDDMQVLKMVEENDEMYKVTVYSVCVYVDVMATDLSSVYIVTKDTMKQYYGGVTRDNTSIFSTYKKYTLNGIQLDPTAIVTEMGEDIPLIEYYIKKLDERGTKYYVSDIVDIY